MTVEQHDLAIKLIELSASAEALAATVHAKWIKYADTSDRQDNKYFGSRTYHIVSELKDMAKRLDALVVETLSHSTITPVTSTTSPAQQK